MGYLLGIDIGTSGTKTLICDDRGKVLATAMAEHPISQPKPGWSEQHPDHWWQATCKATKAIVKKAKVKPADISGIGLSGQMHGSVFLADGERACAPPCSGTTSAPPANARRSPTSPVGAKSSSTSSPTPLSPASPHPRSSGCARTSPASGTRSGTSFCPKTTSATA